jgi:hypothetical protein
VLAASPSEVRTLVYVDPKPKRMDYAAEYRGPTMAIMNKMVVALHIFDLERRVLLGTWHVHGATPPHKIDAYNMPEVPGPPIAEFLESLPRR